MTGDGVRETEDNCELTLPALKPFRERSLLIMSVIWSFFWLLVCLALGDWIPGVLWLAPWLAILTTLFGVGFLVLLFVYMVVLLFKKSLTLSACLPLLIIVGMYFLGSELPSKPAVTFYLNRDEFLGLAEIAQEAYGQSQGFDFPSRSFYKDAAIFRDFKSGATVIEFLIGDFYLPLLFISTDEPEDVYDVCSAGGIPIERLESNWYVCKRDWN